MADITIQPAIRDDNDLTFITPTAVTGDQFVNTGSQYIVVHNDSAGAVTMTVTTPALADNDDLEIEDRVITIGIGDISITGPWPRDLYNDEDRKVTMVFSAVTDIKLAVIE